MNKKILVLKLAKSRQFAVMFGKMEVHLLTISLDVSLNNGELGPDPYLIFLLMFSLELQVIHL